MYYKQAVLCFIAIFNFAMLNGQGKETHIYDFVPKSPEAASLIQKVEVPVGLYTGTANINIPIWNYSHQNLSANVSMNYRTGGVKVGQMEGILGLSWELNAQPVITRKINGLPDELYFNVPGSENDLDIRGFLSLRDQYSYNAIKDFRFNNDNLYHTDNELFDKLAYGCWDSEPDEYYFSIGEYSGNFIFDWDGYDPKVISEHKVQVHRLSDQVNSWKIVTPDGNQYYFYATDAETTTNYSDATAIGCSLETSRLANVISSWHCSEAHDINGWTKIAFVYEDYQYQTEWNGKAISTQSTSGRTAHEYCPGTVHSQGQISYSSHSSLIRGKKISRIEASTGEYASFHYEAQTRQDTEHLLSYDNITSIKYIEVGRGNYVDKRFKCSYIEGVSRTLLESIGETSTEGEQLPPYYFKYYGNSVAAMNSKGIDYWGFSNGSTNQLLIPSEIYQHPGNGLVVKFEGANRSPNSNAGVMGSLHEVTNPTGGKTILEYESHDYSHIMANSVESLEEFELVSKSFVRGATGSTNTPDQYVVKSLTFTLEESKVVEFYIRGSATQTCFQNSKVRIEKADGTSISSHVLPAPSQNYKSESYFLELEAGDYIIKAYANYCDYGNGNAPQTVTGYVVYDDIKVTPVLKKLAGGLRISALHEYDPFSGDTMTTLYKYHEANSLDASSGVIYGEPNTKYKQLAHLWEEGGRGGGLYYGTCEVTQRVGTSKFQLAQSKGSHIGYGRVEEWFGKSKENGSKVSTFSTSKHYADIIDFNPPFAPPSSYSYKTGFADSVYTYDSEGNAVKSVVYSYQDNEIQINRLKIGFKSLLQLKENYHNYATITNSGINESIVYARNFRPYIAGYRKVSNIKTTEYYSAGEFISNDIFIYDSSVQNLKEEIVGSNHTNRVHYEYKYAEDLSRQCLVDRNFTGIPLEILADNGLGEVVSGDKYEYSYFSNGKAVNLNDCSTNTPILLHEYSFWTDDWTPQLTINEVDNNNLPTNVKRRSRTYPEIYAFDGNRLISKSIMGSAGITPLISKWKYKGDSKLVEEFTDVDGQVTDFVYDAYSRLSSISKRDGKVNTKLEYVYYNGGLVPNLNRISSFTEYLNDSLPDELPSSFGNLTVHKYIDGLGRPVAEVKQGYSENGKDVVTNRKYDQFNRVIADYQPYQSPHTDGRYLDISSFVEPTMTEYYSSPLNRVMSVTPPAWHATHYFYETNNIPINHPDGQYFGVGSARIEKIEDPNKVQTEVYTDNLGRQFLTKQNALSDFDRAETYTSYDSRNRVTTIYPPGAGVSDSDLLFKYEYDEFDNLKLKKVPDTGPVEYLYDEQDMLIHTTKPSIPAGYDYLSNVYDDFGRLVQAGFTTHGETSIQRANLLEEYFYGTSGITINRVDSSTVRVLSGTDLGGLLSSKMTYDAYGRLRETRGSHHMNSAHDAQTTSFKYDQADNIIYEKHSISVENQPLSSISETKIDHSGRSIEKWLQVTFNGEQGPRIQTSQTSYTVRDQVMTQRIGKTANGWLQQTDFDYLDNGLLNKINEVDNIQNDLFALNLAYDNPQHGHYATPQYNGNISNITVKTASGNHFTNIYSYDGLNRLQSSDYVDHINPGNTSQYYSAYTYDSRGNMNSLVRQGRYEDDNGILQNANIDELRYDYYEGTNRVKSVTDGWSRSGDNEGYIPHSRGDYKYDTATGNVTYDPSRNISMMYNHLNLPHELILGNDGKIEYLYTANGNKLQERKTDLNSGEIVSQRDYLGPFEYSNNILSSIIHPDGRLVPGIDCQTAIHVSGSLSEKHVYEAERITADAQVLQGAELHLIATEDITFKPSFRMDSGVQLFADLGPCHGAISGWRLEYFLKDHLGNNRVLFADLEGDGIVDATDILQENHYYPFGLEMKGDWSNKQPSTKQRYRYNGKELNPDLGLYDYGARWYDPSIARWSTVDPMAEAIPAHSPYAYTFNNPILYSDPTGMMGQAFTTNVVNEDTGEEYYIDDGYDFDFYVSDSEFNQIKSNGEIKEGTGAYNRWYWAAVAHSMQSTSDDSWLDQLIGWFYTDAVGETLDDVVQQNYWAALAAIPAHKLKQLKKIAKWVRKNIGKKFPGTKKGGGIWHNRDNDLPTHDKNGNPITYSEYDVNPTPKGSTRDAERIVVGSDGKTYYTNDHYKTFTELPTGD